MALKHLIGLDHVVVVVRDLDAAAQNWRRLGFTVSPRGAHSAHMGTGNYTIMLEPDYIELLGVLIETPLNAPTREYVARHEGIERAAFTTADAALGAGELRARGHASTIGPTDFSRPVEMPDGSQSQARFRTFQWPVNERPGGLRIFACQHLSRETVWIPSLLSHANTATGIDRVEMLSKNPRTAADHMGRLIDRAPEQEADGAWRVDTGNGRAPFVFLDRAGLEKRHPGVSLAGLPEEGAAALALQVGDLAAAARAVGAAGVAGDRNGKKTVTVAPTGANGVMLELIEG